MTVSKKPMGSSCSNTSPKLTEKPSPDDDIFGLGKTTRERWPKAPEWARKKTRPTKRLVLHNTTSEGGLAKTKSVPPKSITLDAGPVEKVPELKNKCAHNDCVAPNSPNGEAETPNWGPGMWLNPDEAADYLRLRPKTLANKRSSGNGPRFSKPAGRILYKFDDLTAFLDAGRRGSTSETGGGND